MAMAPFGARPVSPRTERRRARLALTIATLGIGATLLAYAVSPGVRHAVSHAAHRVKHAVSRVLDHDTTKHARAVHRGAAEPATRHPAIRPRPAHSPSGSGGAPAGQPPARTSVAPTPPS